MKAASPDFYKVFSIGSSLRLLFMTIATSSKVGRLTALNRYKDYLDLANRPELLPLHCDLCALLVEAERCWDSYDYGVGYFYQGFRRLGIRGLRDTEARVEAMGLLELLEGKRTLEIGCNTGFLSCLVSPAVSSLHGFDINPFLVRIAQHVAGHLGDDRLTFSDSAFEEFDAGEPAEAVLSFANHSTYDQNTSQTIEEYFERCARMLVNDGLLLFESHPPELERAGLDGVLDLLRYRFDVSHTEILDYGNRLDRGRTFVVANKR